MNTKKMNRATRRLPGRKLLAFALALMVGATFTPMMAGTARAANDTFDSAVARGASNASAASASADALTTTTPAKTDPAKGASDTTSMNSAANAFTASAPAAKAGAGKIEVTDMPDIDLGEIDPEELGDIAIEGVNSESIAPESVNPEDISSESIDSNSIVPPAPGNGGVSLDAVAGTGIADGDVQPLEEADLGDAVPVGSVDQLQALLDQTSQTHKKGASSDSNGYLKLKPDYKKGTLKVDASVTGDTFSMLYITDLDKNVLSSTALDTAAINEKVSIAKFPVGAYSIVLQTKLGRFYDNQFIAAVYSKPTHKKSQYETYSKYLYYKTPAKVTYNSDPDCGLYLDIRKKGAKKWKTYGPLTSAKTSTMIKKLTPNKNYQVRTYFGKKLTIGESSFFISGKDKECKKYTTLTVKTGKKKLPIKSVSVRAVNVKKHTHIIPGYVLNNVGKETWYTYRLKITVKMKKKPGVKAVYISGKKVKGNKKTYSVKFAEQSSIMTGKWIVKPYRKYYKHTIAQIPRGTKYEVKIYSYSNKTYKAYTPIQTRKPKIH